MDTTQYDREKLDDYRKNFFYKWTRLHIPWSIQKDTEAYRTPFLWAYFIESQKKLD